MEKTARLTDHQRSQMINKTLSALVIPLFLVLFTSCLNDTESGADQEVREADEAIEAYLSSNGIDAERQTSGVHIEYLERNEEGRQIANHHVVGILYEMRLLESGHPVETHEDLSEPVRFLNYYDFSNVSIYPAGFNYEIDRLREGERARFYIPSYQAYGSYAHEDLFDAYSHFILEVTVVEVKTEEEIYELEAENLASHVEENEEGAEAYPNSLYHRVMDEGDGTSPSDASVVEFHYTRTYLDGEVIESTEGEEPVQAAISGNQLVRGLSEGLKLMNEGETARLIMPSRLAFGGSLQVLPRALRYDLEEADEIRPLVRPYKSIIYEVELLSVD